ncbi:MAG: GNVR domain-containing protein [candidate division WOR-3 bacterium]
MKQHIRSALETGISWRGLIYGNIAVTIIAALVSVFVAPYRYTAQSVLMPSIDEGTLVLLGGSTPSVGGMGTVIAAGGVFTTPSDIYYDLLNSRSVKESLIVCLRLDKYYKAKTMDDALILLDSHLSSRITPSGMIVLEYTDRDPKLATEALDTLIGIVDAFNQRLIVTKGAKMRVFLEGRIAELEDSMRSVEDSLRRFQSKYKTTGLPEELSGIISAYSQIKAQLITKRYILESMLQYAQPDHPDVIALRRDIASLEAQLAKMEKGGVGGFGAGFGVAFDSLPDVMIELARLQREIETQSEVYAVLLEEYEKAKMLEKRDAPTIQIVDPPRVPQKRAWPKRTIFMIAAAMGAFLISFCMAIYAEGLERLMARMDSPVANTIRTIARDFAFWRRRK